MIVPIPDNLKKVADQLNCKHDWLPDAFYVKLTIYKCTKCGMIREDQSE